MFLALFFAVLALGGAELALRVAAPLHVSTVGHRQAANAKYYGWGYDPGELLRLRDPDTHEVYVDVANNHGWRDRDRTYENAANRLRVLALGDSNTFGVIVPAEQTWTAMLEEMLRAEGFDAEVLNMAYPQWGTDQELEALLREGLRYRPDVVVLQFTINDLSDNTDVRRAASAANAWAAPPAANLPGAPLGPNGFGAPATAAAAKPFYYTFGRDGSLVRHEKPSYSGTSGRNWLWSAVSASEVLKRAYIVWKKAEFYGRPRYAVAETQLNQLKTVLALADTDPLMSALVKWRDRAISSDELDRVVASTGRGADRAVVERILENQPFKKYWTPFQYFPIVPDAQGEDWRLLLALILEIRRLAAGAGASVAILSDQDDGLYEWERYWHRIAPGAENRERFLAPTALLREFADRNGIGFVETRDKHVRARNDSHPNRAGNRAMARNVYDFLLAYHRPALDRHRSR